MTPKQNLVLLGLAILHEPPNKSAIKPSLNKPERDELVEAGLLELRKEGRPEKVYLTEKAWEYLRETEELLVSERSPQTALLLKELNKKVHRFLNRNNLSFVDLFTDTAPTPGGDDRPLAARVREAYETLSNGRPGVDVRLKDLRGALPGTDRESLDYCVLGMVMAGVAQIRQIDDSLAIDERDRDAALEFGGSARHLFKLVS